MQDIPTEWGILSKSPARLDLLIPNGIIAFGHIYSRGVLTLGWGTTMLNRTRRRREQCGETGPDNDARIYPRPNPDTRNAPDTREEHVHSHPTGRRWTGPLSKPLAIATMVMSLASAVQALAGSCRSCCGTRAGARSAPGWREKKPSTLPSIGTMAWPWASALRWCRPRS